MLLQQKEKLHPWAKIDKITTWPKVWGKHLLNNIGQLGLSQLSKLPKYWYKIYNL